MTQTLTITLTDPAAIALVNGLPEHERDRILERYLVLGETVARYATITASDESFQRFLGAPIQDLARVATHLDENRQRFADDANRSVQRMEQQIHTAMTSMQSLRDDFSRVIPVMKTSVARGTVSEVSIFDGLCAAYRDCVFEDVSSIKQSTDILGKPNGMNGPIYIEIKDYTSDVPSAQVEKFWRDMETRKARVGCFISAQTRIATVTGNFAMVKKGDRIGIFVVNAEFNHQGHLYGFLIAWRLAEALEARGNALDAGKMDLIAKIVNHQLGVVQKQIDVIKDLEDLVAKSKKDMTDTMDKLSRRLAEIRTQIDTTISAALTQLDGELVTN